ncbi:putative endo alpha-1,4 polygalactosaminidase [Erysiphe neolycopersici]|uniref:alpha-galactosidase n=1 Tax=Erysiphe neolycopersici TaxID=212602 RepID=A0A420HWU7_9PEZI|nr:putative endo alpha-1,4 polygalactosaminidase [Erysiphe neolycopersici]
MWMAPSSRICHFFNQRNKKFWCFLITLLLGTLIVFAIGLSALLAQREKNLRSSLSRGNFWRPTVGTGWQIVLNSTLTNQNFDAPVYDIDLFLNNAGIIAGLHVTNRKVICYFSAGSFEPFRPDSSRFHARDKGFQLDGWPDEFWLDTNSRNVREIMKNRLKRAARIGCDGVDPDNIDAFDNSNGLGLETTHAINYLHFLAREAHRLNLSIGLKNAGAIVTDVLDIMEWELNEQCLQFGECEKFRPFVDVGKPVFHIEYTENIQNISLTSSDYCGDVRARGFSTVLKHMQLDDWALNC